MSKENIEKRPGKNGQDSFRARVEVKGHKRVCATFSRLTDAKRWKRQTEIAIKEGKYFKTLEATKHTVKELIERYERDVLPLKPRAKQEQHFRWWKEKIGHLILSNLTAPIIVQHRDFRPGNLVIDHGKVQGIIDWSSARGGFAEEDFCPLEFGEWSTQPSYRNSFLAGYASIRKIPDYHRIMPLLRLSRAIGAIGFTVKRGTLEGKGAKIYQFNRQYLEPFLGS